MAGHTSVKVFVNVEAIIGSEWEKKVWGRTRCLIKRPHYQLHQLEVEAGFCSVHYHKQRANRFIVESGCIVVRHYFGEQSDNYCLSAGQEHDVPSLVVHRFRVIEPGTVFEEYWPDRGGEIETDDIVRIRLGGLMAPGDFQ